MVSGQTSFEIVQKALMARIPVLATVSAPSSLARDLVQASNQTLVDLPINAPAYAIGHQWRQSHRDHTGSDRASRPRLVPPTCVLLNVLALLTPPRLGMYQRPGE